MISLPNVGQTSGRTAKKELLATELVLVSDEQRPCRAIMEFPADEQDNRQDKRAPTRVSLRQTQEAPDRWPVMNKLGAIK